ncbi:uncharacterized protein [Antedon mediterranea]|uniref:uncharacterized protein n=1 Tax=Antedon mediterranea TaxID=105859 RepID=UPI003AF990DD
MATGGMDSFNLDLMRVSTWYDERNLLRQLKVLYHDLISVGKIDKAHDTLNLLHKLIDSEQLSSDNLSILNETIKVTQQFGVLRHLSQCFHQAREIEITQFKPYRLQLVDFGNGLMQHHVKRIDALYNIPLKNYEDSWSMIMDLEHRKILCEENGEEVIPNLQQLGQKQTEVQTTSAKGVMRKEVKSDTEKIEEYLLQKQRKLCSQASIFTPALMRDKYKVDISQMFTDMELLKKTENNKGSKQTTLEEVIDIISSTSGCRALIDGEGGIGKTTILRHLSNNWATPGQSIKVFEGKIVFFLSVKDFKTDDDILDLIVKQIDMKNFSMLTHLPQNSKLIHEFLIRHDDKIVCLLDGLDELRFNNPNIIIVFEKKNLENSTVILTSRSENIDDFIKACDVHVKVKGFNEESIGKYIDKHFQYFDRPELGKSLRKELDIGTSLDEKKHPEAYSLCKNPMLLLSICLLWEDSESLPTDKADLFKEIFRSILNQFNNKQKQFSKLSKFEDTPAKYVNAMILLGKCMYNSLKVNQLSINKKHLYDEQLNKDLVDMALKLGFVYEEAPISKSNFESMYMPPHKLIVESLVGFYLCKLCESEGMENECSEDVRLLTPLDDTEWEIIRESEYLKMAREFAIGFLGDKADTFLKHWITNNLSTCRSLPSNLHSIKKQHEISVVNALINHTASNDLKLKKYMQKISTSIRMFIDHISPGIQSDGHFIHLIMQLYGMDYTEAKTNKPNESLKLNTFCSRMALDRKGRVIAHILGIEAKYDKVTIQNLSGNVMNQIIRECLKMGLQVAGQFDICNNNLSNINSRSLGSLIEFPKLTELNLKECHLSGDIMNDVIRECKDGTKPKRKFLETIFPFLKTSLSGSVLKRVHLALESLDISGNNLHSIDVHSLSSLLIMCPKLRRLYMRDCNLSGDVINHLGTECSLKHVQLALVSLNISVNNLHNLDVNSMSSLLIMCPKLESLDMEDCNLSGDIINHLGIECSLKQVQLALRYLFISGNNLHNIDVNSMSSLLIMFPELWWLDMSDCNLSGDVINHLGTECSHKQIQLALESLDISGNNLHNIDVNSMSSLLIMCPKLRDLAMINCNLSVDVKNYLAKERSNRDILFFY